MPHFLFISKIILHFLKFTVLGLFFSWLFLMSAFIYWSRLQTLKMKFLTTQVSQSFYSLSPNLPIIYAHCLRYLGLQVRENPVLTSFNNKRDWLADLARISSAGHLKLFDWRLRHHHQGTGKNLIISACLFCSPYSGVHLTQAPCTVGETNLTLPNKSRHGKLRRQGIYAAGEWSFKHKHGKWYVQYFLHLLQIFLVFVLFLSVTWKYSWIYSRIWSEVKWLKEKETDTQCIKE